MFQDELYRLKEKIVTEPLYTAPIKP